MSTKFEGRSSHYDLIDDIVESPSYSTYSKRLNRNQIYSNYASLPSSLNKTEHSSMKLTNEFHDRFHLTLPRSNSSLIMMNNDERRKEIDLIIKNLYDGKLMSTITDEQQQQQQQPPIIIDHSEPISKNEKGNKNSMENLDLLSLDDDLTSLQRELQEKELDIIHLRKENHELQLENKLLKSKVPTVYSNSYTNNNHEIEILKNELRTSQELIFKLQQQQHQNLIINRSNKIDEMTLHQKEVLEKKLKTHEKQMKILINENEKFKRNSFQFEGIIGQLKRENEDLQQKLNEAKKRNDELFYQEFNTLRNDLKILKQRNNELFDENLRFKQRPNQDSKYLKVDRSASPNISEASDSTNYLTTVSVEHYNTRPSTSQHRSTTLNGNNHHRTIRYSSSIGQEEFNRNKTKSIDLRSLKNKRVAAWDEEHIRPNEGITNHDDKHQITDDSKPSSSHIHQSNYPIHRSTTLNESQHHSRRTLNHDNRPDDHRQTRRNIETVSPRRPYAPISINDVHLNDIIKFSRPGGKISKGVVKYIGSLPDKSDQYLGLELEDEESKHDGIYQDQRLFQCKPNKGVFVAFNKVIMAWSER